MGEDRAGGEPRGGKEERRRENAEAEFSSFAGVEAQRCCWELNPRLFLLRDIPPISCTSLRAPTLKPTLNPYSRQHAFESPEQFGQTFIKTPFLLRDPWSRGCLPNPLGAHRELGCVGSIPGAFTLSTGEAKLRGGGWTKMTPRLQERK